jgi:hypothetical protein
MLKELSRYARMLTHAAKQATAVQTKDNLITPGDFWRLYDRPARYGHLFRAQQRFGNDSYRFGGLVQFLFMDAPSPRHISRIIGRGDSSGIDSVRDLPPHAVVWARNLDRIELVSRA